MRPSKSPTTERPRWRARLGDLSSGDANQDRRSCEYLPGRPRRAKDPGRVRVQPLAAARRGKLSHASRRHSSEQPGIDQIAGVHTNTPEPVLLPIFTSRRPAVRTLAAVNPMTIRPRLVALALVSCLVPLLACGTKSGPAASGGSQALGSLTIYDDFESPLSPQKWRVRLGSPPRVVDASSPIH